MEDGTAHDSGAEKTLQKVSISNLAKEHMFGVTFTKSIFSTSLDGMPKMYHIKDGQRWTLVLFSRLV